MAGKLRVIDSESSIIKVSASTFSTISQNSLLCVIIVYCYLLNYCMKTFFYLISVVEKTVKKKAR